MIKIGGSLITDKNSKIPKFKTEVVKELLTIIYNFTETTGNKVILGHGAGSFGHYSAVEFLHDLPNLSEAQIQARLKMIHAEVRLLANEVHSVAQSLGFEPDLISPSTKLDLVKSVTESLANEKFPIIHGDVNFNGPNFIESTEEQFLKILKGGVQIKKTILVTKFNSNTSGFIDATGGSDSKKKFAEEMKNYCESVEIIDGNDLLKVLQAS